MPKSMLQGAYDNELAAAIRKAIGATATEKVEITTPQFKRPASWANPKDPPSTLEDWWSLWKMSKSELKAIGLGNWNGRTMLLPGEWYTRIPKDFIVIDINGFLEKFEPGKTDDDIRFGCLSYGVAAVDGVSEDPDGYDATVDNDKTKGPSDE